jgi:hypothetical protein
VRWLQETRGIHFELTLLLPVALYVMPWQEAARMLTLQVLASLTMFEFLFYSWQQLPFTCSYVPGKKSPVMIVTAYVSVLGVVVPLVAVMAAMGSAYSPLFGVLFGAACWKARSLRREGWGEARLTWEDTSAGVTDLGIHEMSYRDAITMRTPC